MLVLVTGGLGFIGSHCVVELLNKDYDVIVIDNLTNSDINVIDKIKKITNKDIFFYNFDVQNIFLLENVFRIHKIELVIHFAGLKSVNESLIKPIYYYKNNVLASVNLLSIMEKYNIKNLIFSSSATVYGSQNAPFDENMVTGVGLTNPYAKTKYIIEEILKDIQNNDKSWSIVILRYFNPCGAHESGLLSENPKNMPNNLMPILLKVADGTNPYLNIYGSDYDTIDGTCVRDFVHVVDVACGHIYAIKKLNIPGIHIYNLGTGKGTSIIQLVKTFEDINKIIILHKYAERRSGDIGTSFASISKIEKELEWKFKYNIENMCFDSWQSYKLSALTKKLPI